MPFIDTHCHLNHEDLADDVDGALNRAASAGVAKCIVVGYDLASSRLAVEQGSTFAAVYAAVGIHPYDAANFTPQVLDEIRALAAHPKVVAIGEIGLDFYRDLSPRDAQYAALCAQLELAAELELPIIFHCRDAYPELLEVLGTSDLSDTSDVPKHNPCATGYATTENEPNTVNPLPVNKKLNGVLHCFGGTADEAIRALNLGLYLGFDGPVTFKNADALRDIVRDIPIDRILTETDAPYLTPHPYRGKRNEPAWVALVTAKLAEVKAIDLETFTNQAWTNAHTLFSNLNR